MRIPVVLLTSLLAAAWAVAPAHSQAVRFGDVSLEVEIDTLAANRMSYTIYADNVGERLLFHCDHDGLIIVLTTNNVVAGDSVAVVERWMGTTRRATWEVHPGTAGAQSRTYMASRGAPAREMFTTSLIVPDLELRYATAAGEARSRFALHGLGEAFAQMQCSAL